MIQGEGDYPMPTQAASGGLMRPSLTDRLLAQKENHENQLEKINNILDMLEKNPATAEIFDAVSELGAF